MKLRARLLVSFVAISLLVTFIFGITAYRIASDSGDQRETRLFQRFLEQEVESLTYTHGVDLVGLQASVRSHRRNDYLLLLAEQNRPLREQTKVRTLSPETLDGIDHQLRQGVTAGSVANEDHAIVWAAAPIDGLPLRLIGFYRPAEAVVSPMQTLVVRLAVAGFVTLWITIWGALILTAGLMKRLERQSDALLHQSLYDSLTELPNRQLLFDRLQQAMYLSKRQHTSVALLVIDLDDFKAINDALGHSNGDILLQHVASRLRATFRGSDTVGRLGNDEFALVLPDTTLAQAKACAGKAIAALEAPVSFENIDIRTEPSIGIAVYPDHGDNTADLFRRADLAMHQAKEERSGYAVYESDADARALERLSLVGELRQALDAGALCLYFQPKIRLDDNSVAGAETLLRWPHPVRGFVPPDQFIPLAERTGLIKVLTPWIVEETLKQVAAWKHAGRDLAVAINLSARNLHDRSLPAQLLRLLRGWDLDASHITLEITESAMMLDPAQAMRMLRELADIGVKLSIDDFGTGYSSLAYLQQLPVGEIKIDKSFVKDMTKQERNASIVRATIDLAHNLGLDVVAEGVEDAAAMEQLRALGCDFAQGYHIGRPMSPTGLVTWLLQQQSVSAAPLARV